MQSTGERILSAAKRVNLSGRCITSVRPSPVKFGSTPVNISLLGIYTSQLLAQLRTGLLSKRLGAVDLFILFCSRNKSRPSSRRDMWQSNADKGKRPAAGPRPVSYNIKDPSPSTVRCAQDSGAGVPPYRCSGSLREPGL